MNNFIFGVFSKGKLVFQIGLPIYCSHNTAALIVGILDLAKDSLSSEHYFACDYYSNTWTKINEFY